MSTNGVTQMGFLLSSGYLNFCLGLSEKFPPSLRGGGWGEGEKKDLVPDSFVLSCCYEEKLNHNIILIKNRAVVPKESVDEPIIPLYDCITVWRYYYMIISTNIRLTKEQWKALKMKALMEGSSASALVRKAIDLFVGLSTSSESTKADAAKLVKGIKKKNRDPFFSAIGLGSGGPHDDSTDHDHYLYQQK